MNRLASPSPHRDRPPSHLRGRLAGFPRLLDRPRSVLFAIAVGLAGAGLLSSPDHAPAGAQGGEDLVAYRMVDQWPERTSAAEGLFQNPIDLDVAADGRVFIADPGVGGVHLLQPDGSWATPFGVTGGFPQQLGRVGRIAVQPTQLTSQGGGGGGPVQPLQEEGPEQPASSQRVYVLDPAVERVAIYGLDGGYLDQWSDINGEGIAASADGRVFVLDRDASTVRAFDADTGEELFAFGERGSNDGQFSNFVDVDVAPDGRQIAVADRRGNRVQLFDLASEADLAGETPPPAASHRLTYDLADARFTQGDNSCNGNGVNALGEDRVFVGQGNGACVLDGREVTFAIASSAFSGTICKDTVRLPRLVASAQDPQYFALAVSDPNVGKCGEKRDDLDTTPVVAQYSDESLRRVATVWEAASNEDSDSPILFSPNDLSMPTADTIFVADQSAEVRFFNLEGEQIASSERQSFEGDRSTDFQFFRILEPAGTDVLGEVFGGYVKGQRAGGTRQFESGVGRFRTVEQRTRTGTERVIEPVWVEPQVSRGRRFEVPQLVWNPVSQELLVVRNIVVEQQRTQDVQLQRYTADGDIAGEPFDLPDDGKINPYSDIGVGPDGRIYALDDIYDIVRVFEADGTFVYEVPVAFDARSVAGGPPSEDGQVFVMREPGWVERHAEDGRVTARLDGRPLDFSDPTTLTDFVVDGAGRVYVADGQTSLISVFQETDAANAIPVPNDDDCLFRGLASVDPATIALGETATVTLELLGSCGVGEPPTDIVVVVPYFERLEAGVDPSLGRMTSLTQLVARVDFTRHRAGIVSYYNTVADELPLVGDRDAFIDAARNVTRFTPPNEDLKARLRDAIEHATEMFVDDDRRKVMVLLDPDYCNPNDQARAAQCAGYPPAEDAAAAARAAGITMVVVNGRGAFDLASSDEDVVFNQDGAHRRMVAYAPPPALATDISLVDTLPASIVADPAGLSGNGAWNAPAITWTLDELGHDGAVFTAVIEPQAGGMLATAALTVADLRDGWGQATRVTFPIPQLEVIAPTGVPTAPPADTPTPEPTGTARPLQPVYLPVAFNERCLTRAVPVEIAIVVDVSSSMGQPTSADGPSKLDAAREAATAFVDALREDDRAAVIAFDAEARTLATLADGRQAARDALAGLTTGEGTAIDAGIDAGLVALTTRREGAWTALVLLTDGRPSSEAYLVEEAAVRARAADVTVYTIGLGADVDEALLQIVAGDPSRALVAPDVQDLAPIFEQLHANVVESCP